MDFRLLYDAERKLFHIGYNVTPGSARRALLRSAGLGGAARQLPRHREGRRAGGALVHARPPDDPGVGRPAAPVVGRHDVRVPHALAPDAQPRGDAARPDLRARGAGADRLRRADGRAVGNLGVCLRPRRDAQQTYQYQSFGVPGLGFKRGLEDDVVIAPYASVLAVSIRPRAVLEQHRSGSRRWACSGRTACSRRSTCTPSGRRRGAPFAVVRSYMAHHQGMLLVALNNLLNDQIMVERFHADREVETGELLLNERGPAKAPREWPRAEQTESAGAAPVEAPARAPSPWVPAARASAAGVRARQRSPLEHRDGSAAAGACAGKAGDHALPARQRRGRRRPVALPARRGQAGACGSRRRAGGRTTYAAAQGRVSTRRDEGISVHVDVAVAPADDVEVRHDHAAQRDGPDAAAHRDQRRRARAPAAWARRRPTRRSPGCSSGARFEDDLDALVFVRRPRSSGDEQGGARSPAREREHRRELRGLRDRPGGLLRSLRERARSEGARDSGTTASRPGRRRARSRHESDGPGRAEAEPDGDARLRHQRRPHAHRGARARPAVRLDARGSLGLPGRRARERAGASLARGSSPSSCRPCSSSSPRSSSPIRRCEPRPRSSPPRARASVACGGEASPATIRSCSCACDDAEAPLLRESIAAQRYLRSCGIRLDLVLVDEQASGYVTEGAGTLRSVLAAADVDEWLNRHGGIFVLAADQLQGDERAPPRGERARRARYARRLPRRSPRAVGRAPTQAASRSSPRSRTRGRRARLRDPDCSSTTASEGFTEDGARVRDLGAPRPARRPRRGATSWRIRASAAWSASRRSARPGRSTRARTG